MNETETQAASFNQPREWLLWTAATIGGWLLGSALNILLSIVLSMTGLDATLNAAPADVPQESELLLYGVLLIGLLLIGLSVGGLQWLVLRRHVTGLQRWAIFTGLGFALGTFAYWPLMGVSVGLMQWLLLRRDLNKTAWWPVINALAWPLGYMFGSLGATVGASLGSPLLSTLLSTGLAGAIIGGLTGAMLLWLLRENRVLLDGLRQERAAEQAPR